jgi:hypothetical protein
MSDLTAFRHVPPSITLLTALAEASDLSDAEYRAIYQRVAAAQGSLRNIRDALDPLHQGVSHTWWARYSNGDCALDRARKNDLRRWAGLPELPPAVAEAVADSVHPDAAVYRVGVASASRVLLIGSDVPAIDLRVNGSLGVLAAAPRDAVYMPVQGTPSDSAQETVHPCPTCRERPESARPRRSPRVSIGGLKPATRARLDARRRAHGWTWDEYLDSIAALADATGD